MYYKELCEANLTHEEKANGFKVVLELHPDIYDHLVDYLRAMESNLAAMPMVPQKATISSLVANALDCIKDVDVHKVGEFRPPWEGGKYAV